MSLEPVPEFDETTTAYQARVPNFGHFALFCAISLVLLFVLQAAVLGYEGALTRQDRLLVAMQDQRTQLLVMALAYVATLGISAVVFPRMWHRRFLAGVGWNWRVAGRWAGGLVLLGFVMGWLVQAGEVLITMPKSIPMDAFFKSAAVVWALTLFGTLLGPLFEEIAFRGFLFPALAIAWDWMRLPGDAGAYAVWRSGDGLSRTGLVVGGVVSSGLFALVHAAQLGWTWAAVLVLMGVSLVLTWVRWRTGSVAASTVVHACYNLSVFVTLFVSTGGYRHLERVAR